MKNYFFQKTGYQKKKGFDSFSKNADDILAFYTLKYPELSAVYKHGTALSREEFGDILAGSGLPDTPFERYILAFLFAMDGRHTEAEAAFLACIASLSPDKGLDAAINTIFIQLQLAQLYERKGDIDGSLAALHRIYFTFNHRPELMAAVNNFYASCCISIGLLYFKVYRNKHIAGNLFAQSIHVRVKYKDNYPPLVCENYLATAYRYKAVAYCVRKIDKYVNFKLSYHLRTWLLNNTTDEFTKVEFFNLSVDLIHFLISEDYPVKYINKVSNRLYKTIISLNHDSKQENRNALVQGGLMISKYYFFGNDPVKFYKWHALIKQFKYMFRMDFDESFLNSEAVFHLLKAGL